MEKRSHRPLLAILHLLLPGLHQIRSGKRRTGTPVLVLYLVLVFLLIFRWESFLHLFQSSKLELWITPVLVILMLGSLLAFSTYQNFRRNDPGKQHSKSPFQIGLERFSANQLAVISLYIILSFFLLAILAPLIAPYDPLSIKNITQTRYLSPSLEHPFGTDEFGRDLFSRALYGARVSLSVGILSVMVAITIGTVYGAVSAYFGGLVDNILMRIVDVINAFPIFFLMLILVGIFEVNILVMVLIMGFTSWMGTARYIRGEILSLKERDFIVSARAIGLPPWLIIGRHLIPNALSPVLVSAALMVGGMIGAEAGLSFLGIGIRPPTPTWGNMINAGEDTLLIAWWIAFFPGSLLAITIVCFNLIADGLRDALDPKTLMRKFI